MYISWSFSFFSGEEEKEKQVHHLLRRLQTSPPSLPYPAILRRLLNKKKETHFLLYHASKQKNTTTIISERSSAFLCVLVKLVDCADASCECSGIMSQLLPQSYSTIYKLGFLVFNLARGMNEWEREVWEDGEQFQFFLPGQQHYLTVLWVRASNNTHISVFNYPCASATHF